MCVAGAMGAPGSAEGDGHAQRFALDSREDAKGMLQLSKVNIKVRKWPQMLTS